MSKVRVTIDERIARYARDPQMLQRMLMVADGPPDGVTVRGPESLHRVVGPLLAGLQTERLVAVALNQRYRVVDAAVMSEGSDCYTVVCTRTILRWALTRDRAVSAIAVAHNHPSGDPSPSPQDIDVTRALARACRVVGVSLLDHLVVSDHLGYRSLAEEGHCAQ